MKAKDKARLLAFLSFVYTTPIALYTMSDQIVYAMETELEDEEPKENGHEHKSLDAYLTKVATFYQMDVETVKNVVASNIEEILSYGDVEKGIIAVVEPVAPKNTLKTEYNEGEIKVGSRYDENAMNEFKQTEAGMIMTETTQRFGIDPELLIALCKQESGLDHEGHLPSNPNYTGSGYGITQQEYTKFQNGEYVITGNTYTEEGIVPESITVSEATAEDLEGNITMGTIYLQQSLKHYHYNLFMALQGYNYGTGMMDIAIESYAAELGVTTEQVMENYNDLGWMKYVEDIYYAPQKYVPGWQQATYGDHHYASHVLSYIGKSTIYIQTENGLLLYYLGNMETVFESNTSVPMVSNVQNVGVITLDFPDIQNEMKEQIERDVVSIRIEQVVEEKVGEFAKVFTLTKE